MLRILKKETQMALQFAKFIVFILLNIPVLTHATTIWEVQGTGHYSEAEDGEETLVVQSELPFKAQVSTDGRYRLEVNYKNLRDILIFDGTGTICYRIVNDDRGEFVGADVVVQNGSFPETVSTYLQALWMATSLNLMLNTDDSTEAVNSLVKGTQFRQDFGDELASQLVIKKNDLSDKILVKLYLPGDSTRDGNKVFTSPAYADGLLFQRLAFLEPRATWMFFTEFNLSDYMPYKEPETPDDVGEVRRFSFSIEQAYEISAISDQLPALKGLVAVSDYSTTGGTNLAVPRAYGIKKWGDLKPAQARARASVPETEASPPDHSARWIVLFALFLFAIGIPMIIWKILLRKK